MALSKSPRVLGCQGRSPSHLTLPGLVLNQRGCLLACTAVCSAPASGRRWGVEGAELQERGKERAVSLMGVQPSSPWSPGPDRSVSCLAFLKTRAAKFESAAASLIANGPRGENGVPQRLCCSLLRLGHRRSRFGEGGSLGIHYCPPQPVLSLPLAAVSP